MASIRLRPQQFELAPPRCDRFVAGHFAGLAAALEIELELVQLVLDRRQLRRAKPVDEQLAVEVVGLVLQDAGHVAFDVGLDFVALEVVRLDVDRLFAHDWSSHFGDAQAAFLVFDLSPALAEHRIDEHELGIFLRGSPSSIGHEQSVRQIDLIRRQPDAFVRVHQLEHLGDDLSQLGVDLLDRPRQVPQRRMRILDDFEAQGIDRGAKEA